MAELLLLWLVPPAEAHFPHLSVLAAAAVSGVPYALVQTDSDVQPRILLRLDGGFWEPDALPAGLGEPVGMVAREGELLILDDADVLWSRPQDGAWDSITLDVGTPRGLASSGAAVWVCGSEQVVSVTEDGDAEPVALGGAARVTAMGDLVAWADGDVVTIDGDGEAQAPHGEVTSLTTDGATVWAGHANGVDRLDAGAWTPCGALPADDVTAPFALEVDMLSPGNTLVAGTGQDLYLSTDACASWARVQTDGPVSYGEESQPKNASDRWRAVTAADEGIRAYGWSGVWNIAPAAVPVATREALLGMTTAHTIAPLSSVGKHGPAVLVGMYGDGDARLDDEWEWLDFPDATIPQYFVRSAATDGDEALITFDNGLLHVESDTVRSVSSGLGWPASVAYTGTRWWVADRVPAEGAGAWSTDGVTFTASDTLTTAAEGAERLSLRAVPLASGPALFALLKPSGLLLSDDDGDTWVRVSELTVTDITCDPDGIRLIAATSDGLATSDDRGRTFTLRLATPGVTAVSAGTHTVYAGDRAGQVWRSIDSGLLWAADGRPQPGGVFALATLDDEVLLATAGGLLRGDTYTPVALPQRYSLTPGLVGCSSASGAECAIQDQGDYWILAAGDTLSFRSTGAVLAIDADRAAFTVEVDGVASGTVDPRHPIVLPDSGWHQFALRAEGDSDVRFIELLPAVPHACGCASTGGVSPGIGWVLGLLYATRLRRRVSAVRC